MSTEQPLLQARGIHKRFGPVKALRGVDFEVANGETVAIMGDNGAGKSTLLKILVGAQGATEGELAIDGEPVTFSSPRDATAVGISVVHQDLALVDTRDVVANVFLGRELRKGLFLDQKRMLAESAEVLESLDIKIPSLRANVGQLSGGQRQAVAIGRAVHEGGRLLFMDEPTAALGVEEQRKVLELILEVRRKGRSIAIVSHNLEHVFQVSDRIVVLRAGELAGVRRTSETSADEIVKLIIGGDHLHISLHDAVDDTSMTGGSER